MPGDIEKANQFIRKRKARWVSGNFLDAYVQAKRHEVESYRRHVPVWDFNKYFGI